MSDPNANVPLDPGSTTDPTSTNSAPTDPNDTNPSATDPNSTDSTSTDPTDPNAGTTTGTTATDPNSGLDSGTVDGTDSDGQPQTTGPASLPSATPAAIVPNSQSAANQTMIASSPNSSDVVPLGFDSKSADFRKAIIIASAVSGAVGLILVAVVIFLVYRRRNRRRGGDATFVNAMPKGRPTSDSTWIGGHMTGSPVDSFDENKLEAGDRNSNAESIDSDATLADLAAARAKSGAFATPKHSPRPSMEKISVANDPLVPGDPFGAPRRSLADRPRPSFEQVPALQSAPVPRVRKSGTPSMRINSSSSFDGEVVVEQGPYHARSSLGFLVPLVTPMGPPAEWRSRLHELYDDEDIPVPARPTSIISLSRQSSRASSRNSRILDVEVTSPRRKSTFLAVAKKRRSRADSIDPFRKSNVTMTMARRKSARTESMAARSHAYITNGPTRRKSRAESIAQPTTPGRRRESRAALPTTPRRRSQATNPIANPTQGQIFSTPIAYTPSVPLSMGLPKTPRTPTAARQSRAVSRNEPVTPRTPRGLPPTPRTSGLSLPPTPRTSGVPLPQTPRSSGIPTEAHTPRTPKLRVRQPRAPLPRTPTSLDDAHWETLPLPDLPVAVPAPATSRPLPMTPKTSYMGPAELRLSQVSRSLSEVSGDSPV